MSSYELNIRCDSANELRHVISMLSAGAPQGESHPTFIPTKPAPAAASADTSPEAIAAAQAGGDGVVDQVEEKPKRGRGKAKAAAEPEPTQEPDGTPIPPTREPAPQPTPGGTEAPPAESIPPNQADVFGGGNEASTGQPAAGSGDTADVDLPALKNAMAELLRVKPAAFAMTTLEAATGCKSLSSGSPSVIEKAKDDPGIMKRALDALVAGKTAA